MPKRTSAYAPWLANKLKDPRIAEEYLKASRESPEEFLKALRKVAEAHRVSKVAEAAGRQRESVYRMLSEEGNPRLDSLWSVLRAMGLRLNVEAIPNQKIGSDMDQQTAMQVIGSFLHDRVGNTGVSGFEGLVAVLFQLVTGQEFRLSSSGRQSGRDAASESGYANIIKVESKHYRETTALNLRELIAEIHEAAESDPNLDVWVLATSRSVSEQISSSLDQQAEFRGVEVVLLDLGINGLPRLPVLMAAFPDVVIEWANCHQLQHDPNELKSALSTIATAQDFEPTKNRLFDKLNGNISYASARHRTHSRLLETLSVASNAQSAFRQSLAIRTPDAVVIRRTKLNQQFDEWWGGQSFPRPAVALGDEGTGKTWAVFDWVMGRVDHGNMPIVLPFAAVAQDLTNSDPLESLLPRLLAKWTGVLDERRWKRRLDRWVSTAATGRPLILLIVDGLNERASLDWRPFFSILSSNPWRERIAVIATDRTHHWRTRCSMAGLSTFCEIEVGGYSDAELDQALAASKLSHTEIPQELLPLITIPRYCRLVVNHFAEMNAAADFTRERLIYLEIRDRHASKLNYPLTDEGLFEIIRDLAERARTNAELKPKDLRCLIGVPGGDDANIYEEIVSGGLVVAVPGKGMITSYKVAPLRLVYGFGMLLAAELALRSSSTGIEIEEFLTSWFEPQPDMDRKVDICGSAMFHALFQAGFPESPLRELIRYWLGLRNWADTAQSAFTMYVLRHPEIFVEVAEDFWSSAHDSGAAQEFLGRAFVTHRDDPKLQRVLVPAIERWMGFIHPLGRRFWEYGTARKEQLRKIAAAQGGENADLTGDDTDSEDRVRKDIELRAGCTIVPGEIEVAGTNVTVVSDGSLLRLARLGLMIMSTGDPSPFIHSLTHWAVASAVMDDSDFSDLSAWVVRLAEGDAETILLEHARRFLELREATASAAARILLLAIGTQASESLIEENDLTPNWYKELRAEHASDPCKSYYNWTESESLSCLGREDVALHIILGRAALPIVDPSITVPSALIRRAKESLQNINPSMVRAGSSHTIESHHLETLTQLLCAHAPSEIGDFMRGVVRTMPDRDLTGQYYIAVQLSEISLVLKAEEVNVVSRVLADLSTDASEWSIADSGSRHTRKIAEARAFSGIAPHLSASEFFRRFIVRPANTVDLIGFELWFAPLSHDETINAIATLHTPPDQATLNRILWVLPYLKISLSEVDRGRLVQLADSEDAGTSGSAMRVAVATQDESLGQRMVDLGRAVGKHTHPWDERWLTLLLARFASHLSFDDIAKRLRPFSIGFVIAERGYRPDEIAMYGSCLDRQWQGIVSVMESGIEHLPAIKINNGPDDSGTQLPELYEPTTSQTIRLGQSRSWTSGPPTDPASQLKEVFRTDAEEIARELNQDRQRKVDSILAAWDTDAFQWYGRGFSLDVMDRLYQQSPALLERWIRPALIDSLAGLSVRIRLGSFLEPICRVLLNRNPALGLQLWTILHKQENNPIVFDTRDIAFSAEDTHESNVARKIILEECWNDESIAQVAFTCDRSDCQAWMDSAIEDLISAKRLWKRAKGLTLASFSGITTDPFEELVSRASVSRSWAEKSLTVLRRNVRKNRLARHWYSVFLTAEDADAAWGAFQIVLAIADERFLSWHVEIEKQCAAVGIAEKRLRFLSLGWNGKRDLRKVISREKERKDLLFGLEIQRGEIFPFML
jgi:probable addiction module antidote protein